MIRSFYIMPLNHRATEERVSEFIADYDACDQFIAGLSASADSREGLAAVIEKRKPVFRGL